MDHAALDSLSGPVWQLLAGARAAGAYEQLVVRTQQTQWPPDLESWSADDLFDGRVTRSDEARCVLAGLWLFVDELERAHRIVQDIGSASGSFWHAIIHRREADFSNSRYWYARCREHPALRGDEADPHGPELVSLVESAHDLPPNDPRRQRAVAAQRREWERLIDHCARAAVSGGS